MITAGEVMDRSASLLNDTAKTLFTYSSQLPYLSTALDELLETLEQNNIGITNYTKTGIVVTAGVTVLTTSELPANLIEIQRIWERTNGTSEEFVPVTRQDFLPPLQVQTTSLVYWSWQNQEVRLLGATSDRELRIDYVGNVTTFKLADENDEIPIINAMSFLSYRNAALCAQFIGENKERSNDLNQMAIAAMDRMVGINVKGQQVLGTRRRPFMSSYKIRGGGGYY
jgi:hypothetical protein